MFLYLFPLSVYVFSHVDIEGSHRILVLACLWVLVLATTESFHLKGPLFVIESIVGI